MLLVVWWSSGVGLCRVRLRACYQSDADAELHDVAVTHDVILALYTGLTRRPYRDHGTRRHQVIEGHDLGLDEMLLKIGMDLARGFGGGGAAVDGPGPGLLGSGGEKGLQTEGREADS